MVVIPAQWKGALPWYSDLIKLIPNGLYDLPDLFLGTLFFQTSTSCLQFYSEITNLWGVWFSLLRCWNAVYKGNCLWKLVWFLSSPFPSSLIYSFSLRYLCLEYQTICHEAVTLKLRCSRCFAPNHSYKCEKISTYVFWASKLHLMLSGLSMKVTSASFICSKDDFSTNVVYDGLGCLTSTAPSILTISWCSLLTTDCKIEESSGNSLPQC
jgi:hypothetical protein